MTHINQRRDTASNWASANPVLQLGEVGWETDTRKSKLGDGVSAWNDMLYARGFGTPADVGLDQVDNTRDSAKPISDDTQAALDLKANLASPHFTGLPTATTQVTSDSSTKLATTAFVRNQFTDTILLGSPTVPTTPAVSDNDKSVANTEFTQAAIIAGIAAVLAESWAAGSTNGSILLGSLRVNFGAISASMGGAANASGAITFNTSFSAAPYVYFMSVGTSPANKLIGGRDSTVAGTTTGCGWAIKTGDGTTSSASPTLYYLVIGPA